MKFDRMKFRQPGRLLVVGLLSGLWGVASAQQGDAAWAAVVAAAKKEGRVNYYSAANPAPLARMVDGFKKAYPDIAIDFQRIPSGPLLTKIDQDRASNPEGAAVAKAEVVDQHDHDVGRALGSGHLESRRGLGVAGIERGDRRRLRLVNRQHRAIQCVGGAGNAGYQEPEGGKDS